MDCNKALIKPRDQNINHKNKNKSAGRGLLCCVKKNKKPKTENVDRVERAFRRLDINNDGYIDWEEFKKVHIT